MKITRTIFPDGIDSRVYAQDITLNDLETFGKYQTLLAQGKYTEASDLLNNSDVYFYGAWMLNLLEKRLNAIGDYLVKLERDVLTHASETEPENIEYGMHWISDEFKEPEPEMPEEPETPEIPENSNESEENE